MTATGAAAGGEDAVSPVPREARPYQGQRAGLVTRALAAAVDMAVVVLVLVVGYAAVNIGLFLVSPRSFSFATTAPLVSVTTALVVAVLYLAVCWAVTGRSYGCHLLGLRVVNRAGHRPGALRALLRAMLYVAFPLGLVWAVGPHRRSLQDLAVGTTVVYDWRPGA